MLPSSCCSETLARTASLRNSSAPKPWRVHCPCHNKPMTDLWGTFPPPTQPEQGNQRHKKIYKLIKVITYEGGKLKGDQGGSKASPYVFLEYFDLRIVYNLIKDKFLSKICRIISGCSGHVRFTEKL